MTIGEKIYEMRTSHNMSLREFAKVTGITHTTIARLESPSMGTKKIFLETVYQICKRLKYDFGQFLTETGYLPDSSVKAETNSYSYDEQKIIEDYRDLNASCQRLVRETVKTLSSVTKKN